VAINNVVINHFIFVKGIHAELFSSPPKPPRCDFQQWIDDYMTSSDKAYVAWVKKSGAM
jgi:hypothetical protein